MLSYKSMRHRDQTIDLLRGLSILQVIYMHVTPYFGSLPLAAWITNWGQAVVPLLLYCSMAVSKPMASLTWSTYIGVVIKRMRRLLLPYYFFLVLYIVLNWSLGKLMSAHDLWMNITVTGGISYNWLVLLFIILGLMIPWFQHAYENHRRMWVFVYVFTVLAEIWALYNRAYIGPTYRTWMLLLWIPFIPTFQIIGQLRMRAPKKLFFLALSLATTFFILYLAISQTSMSLHMTPHKYPPDIYYFLYSIAVVASVIWVTPMLVRLLPRSVSSVVAYCSRVSYELYFAHILVLTWLDVSFPQRDIAPWLFTMLVFGGSFVLVWVGAQITTYIRSKHHE